MDSSKQTAQRIKLRPRKDQPGYPSRPETFIKCNSNEQKVAAYLGYNDAADLRAFAVSWPMLRALTNFEPFPQYMSPETALSLIHKDPESFKNIGNPAEVWAQVHGDSHSEIENKESYCLAAVLMQLTVDIGVMESNSMAQNEKHQEMYRRLWESKNAQRIQKLPEANLVRYPHVSLEEEKVASTQLGRRLIMPPRLGPHHGESYLERYNRCWAALEYFRKITLILGNAATFSAEGFASGTKVESHNIPAWMRQSQTTNPCETEKSESTKATDALTHEYFEVSWLHMLDDEEGVQAAIKTAKNSGITKPSQRQPLQADPRLFKGRELEDQIRKQFSCTGLKTDILYLYLSYFTNENNDKDDRHDRSVPKKRVEKIVEVNFDEWPKILKIITALENSIFVFQVGFYVPSLKRKRMHS